jgi:hypothetical protein
VLHLRQRATIGDAAGETVDQIDRPTVAPSVSLPAPEIALPPSMAAITRGTI